MVNYAIKYSGRAYSVIDLNTNRAMARFLSETDAQHFLDTLLHKFDDNRGRPQNNMNGNNNNFNPNPYSNNGLPYTGQQMMPQYNPMMQQQMMPQYNPMMGMNPMMPQYNPMMGMNPMMQQQMLPPIIQPIIQQPQYQQPQPIIQQQPQQPLGLDNAVPINIAQNQVIDSAPAIVDFDMPQSLTPTPMEVMDQETLEIEFDDSNLEFDDNSFMQDRLGALIKLPKELETSNADDNSLGEAAAFRVAEFENNDMMQEADYVDKQQAYNGFDERIKEKENKRNKAFEQKMRDKFKFKQEDQYLKSRPQNYDEVYTDEPLPKDLNNDLEVVNDVNDLDAMGGVVENKKPSLSNDPTSYADNLMGNDVFVPTANKGDVIDLGPVNEQDDIFSTPRRDAEADDYENYQPTKSDKKAVKKAKKQEEINKKKLAKLLK